MIDADFAAKLVKRDEGCNAVARADEVVLWSEGGTLLWHGG